MKRWMGCLQIRVRLSMLRRNGQQSPMSRSAAGPCEQPVQRPNGSTVVRHRNGQGPNNPLPHGLGRKAR